MHDEPGPSDLDPVDWGDFRAQAHALLDVCLDHVAGVRGRDVWRPVPDAARAAIATPPSLEGCDLGAVYVERAVIDWCRGVFGFPEAASGVLVGGTLMAAGVIALNAARTAPLQGVRKAGLRGARLLVGYASAQTRTCLAKAFEVTGLGFDALRPRIAADKEAGLTPFYIDALLNALA